MKIEPGDLVVCLQNRYRDGHMIDNLVIGNRYEVHAVANGWIHVFNECGNVVTYSKDIFQCVKQHRNDVLKDLLDE